MHYVMTDIHGDFYHFMKMLEEIRFSGDDELYLLGDVIDRGPESLEMLDFCMHYENVHLIKGNHEYFMELTAKGKLPEDRWRRFGGSSTVRQLKAIPWYEQETFYDYVSDLPWYLVLDEQEIPELSRPLFLTHTGFLNMGRDRSVPDYCVPDYSGREVFDIERAVRWWSANRPWEYSISLDLYDVPEEVRFDKRLLVGHAPTISGYAFEPVPYVYEKREYMDLDCGCGYRDMDGRLACYRIEDDRLWYL